MASRERINRELILSQQREVGGRGQFDLDSFGIMSKTQPDPLPGALGFSRAVGCLEYVYQCQRDRQDHWAEHDSQHAKNLKTSQHGKEYE